MSLKQLKKIEIFFYSHNINVIYDSFCSRLLNFNVKKIKIWTKEAAALFTLNTFSPSLGSKM